MSRLQPAPGVPHSPLPKDLYGYQMAPEKMTGIDAQLAAQIAEFIADPLGYVMFMFPWDKNPLIQMVELQGKYKDRFNCKFGPDNWACGFLDEWGQEIRRRGFDGVHAVEPIQFSTRSGHGIGKSALVGFISKFIMDTRPMSKGTVTANTDSQLRTKTWAEIGKWHNLSATRHWFNYNTGRGAMSLSCRLFDGRYKDIWRLDAQTCREENSEAFAGQHAPSATSFYIFDEASGIADKIFEVREGGLTDGEPMVFDFGNPTRNSGRFRENCVGKFRKRFITRAIDSRTVQITNKGQIERWIEDYGIESDFVKVRVLGEFPAMGTLQFIPTDAVDEAMRRPAFVDRTAPLVIGVDVARFGDDETVIYPRVGYDARTHGIRRFHGLSTDQVAGQVIEMIADFERMGLPCSGLFVDETGVGAGVVDILRNAGYVVNGINFGSKPIDSKLYRFRVDEMWGRMREAIKSKLLLPGPGDRDGMELREELIQREFGFTIAGAKISLESKDDLKARGLPSPDLADALALTFAQVVAPVLGHGATKDKPQMAVTDFDPLEYDNGYKE